MYTITLYLNNGKDYEFHKKFESLSDVENAVEEFMTKLKYINVWLPSGTLVYVMPKNIASLEISKVE